MNDFYFIITQSENDNLRGGGGLGVVTFYQNYHLFEKMTSLYIELMMLHVPQMVMFVAGITTITSTAEV